MAILLKSRRHEGFGRSRTTLMTDINVTPMVDVMLVLLVIFMVTAPLLTVGVNVDLPETRAPAISGQDEPLAVSVDRAGQIFIQDTAVDIDALAPRIRAISGNNPDVRIFVRGDRAIDYGRVMAVMGAIHSAGFNKIALLASAPQEGPPKRAARTAKSQAETGKTR
jgi:biopolymer transport protein TolR